MRVFEGINLALLLILSISLIYKNKINDKERNISVILLTAGWILQLLFEGYRWQSLAAIIGSLLTIATIGNIKRYFMWLAITFGSLSLLLYYLFPIPSPGTLSGEFTVGSLTLDLVDESRHEIYAEEQGGFREFVVKIWYPADATNEQTEQWMVDIEQTGPALAEWLGLPSFILNHLEFATVNAVSNLKPSEHRSDYPLLIFSHGWTGFKEQNSFLMEELASNGYIVASINHTYGSILTVFEDGRAIPRNPEALPSGVSLDEYDIASNLLVTQWANDIDFTISYLNSLDNQNDFILKNFIDFNRIGVMGHSTGAGAAIQFCGEDKRCDAVLGMDPWMEPVNTNVISNGLTQPLFILFSENWDSLDRPERNYGYAEDMMENSSGDMQVATVEGTKHMDYSMLPLLTPLAEYIGLKGPINGNLILEIVNKYAVVYFDNLFYDEPELIEEIEGYPEVKLDQMPENYARP